MKRNLIPLALVGLMTLLAAGGALLGVRDRGRGSLPSSVLLSSSGVATMTAPSTGLPSQPQGTTVKRVFLSGRYIFNELVSVDDHVEAIGQPLPGVNAAHLDQCVRAPVDERSLKIGPARSVSCQDPSTAGATVGAVVTATKGGNSLAVSIARVDTATGQVSVGPPIMLCAYVSDTRPVIASGGGSIWVYDVATPFGAVAVEVSATTGVLEDTVSMPKLYRPLMAADSDGLWIGNSIQGSPTPDVLYHVAPASKTVVAMVPSLASGARPRDALTAQWITASGHHVWAGIGVNLTQESIWRFNGPNAGVAFKVKDRGFDPYGEVVGNLSEGLWTEVPAIRLIGSGLHPVREDILEINPATGAEKVIAKLAPLPTLNAEIGPLPQQMVFVDGSLYLLQPPFEADGYLGYSQLIKVTSR